MAIENVEETQGTANCCATATTENPHRSHSRIRWSIHSLVRIALTKQSPHQKYLRRSIPLYMLATWSP